VYDPARVRITFAGIPLESFVPGGFVCRHWNADGTEADACGCEP
jgi:hypothetical protein